MSKGSKDLSSVVRRLADAGESQSVVFVADVEKVAPKGFSLRRTSSGEEITASVSLDDQVDVGDTVVAIQVGNETMVLGRV